jgi:AraC-like DNA-binding protein
MKAASVVLNPETPKLLIRTEHYFADTKFEQQKFNWGKLHYAATGVVDFEINGKSLLSPPQYAIWIPPDVTHQAKTRYASEYATLQVRRDQCFFMPDEPSTLQIDEILRVIIADFAIRGVTVPESPTDIRLADVLIDRLKLSQRYDNYLPFSQSHFIRSVLEEMYNDPACRLPLSHWSDLLGISERTLARKFSEELGMSFDEWRQRCKIVQSMALLEQGISVQEIAVRTGYSSSSSFIAMFRRQTGVSPKRLTK